MRREARIPGRKVHPEKHFTQQLCFDQAAEYQFCKGQAGKQLSSIHFVHSVIRFSQIYILLTCVLERWNEKKIDMYTVSFVNECSVRLLNLRQEAQDVQISTAVMKTAGDIFREWDRFNVKRIFLTSDTS